METHTDQNTSGTYGLEDPTFWGSIVSQPAAIHAS